MRPVSYLCLFHFLMFMDDPVPQILQCHAALHMGCQEPPTALGPGLWALILLQNSVEESPWYLSDQMFRTLLEDPKVIKIQVVLLVGYS